MTDGCLQQSLVMVMTAGYMAVFLSGQTQDQRMWPDVPKQEGTPNSGLTIGVGGHCVIPVPPEMWPELRRQAWLRQARP